MNKIRLVINFTLFVIVLSSCFVALFFARFSSKYLNRRRYAYIRIIAFTCKICLFWMRIRVNVINPPAKNKHYLLAGNHLGMLDMLVLSSVRPTLYITSNEMRETPVIGNLAEMSGCLFVERRDRSNIEKEMLSMRSALLEGFNLTLYPESVSTNGAQVLPFKKTLLMAVAGTRIPIKPMVINYRSVNGEPMSDKWRDSVCWYGDQTFLGALSRLLQIKNAEVDLEFCEEILVESEEQRQEIATRAHAIVSAKYTPII